MIVSCVNSKGGVGKTTSIMFLADVFARRGHRVLVLDLDRQGSATDWADRAADAGAGLGFEVRPANLRRLSRYATSGEFTVVLVDTPPSDPQTIDAALGVSDFVVVPTGAAGLDVARVWDTLPAVASRDVPYGVLLTAARLGTSLLDSARAVFDAEGVARFDTVIPLRERIRSSFAAAPAGDFGYADVADEIAGALA